MGWVGTFSFLYRPSFSFPIFLSSFFRKIEAKVKRRAITKIKRERKKQKIDRKKEQKLKYIFISLFSCCIFLFPFFFLFISSCTLLPVPWRSDFLCLSFLIGREPARNRKEKEEINRNKKKDKDDKNKDKVAQRSNLCALYFYHRLFFLLLPLSTA